MSDKSLNVPERRRLLVYAIRMHLIERWYQRAFHANMSKIPGGGW